MMRLREAAEVLGGTLQGGDVRFVAVNSDSRSIAPGELFVALRGERFDGADFVADAVRRGAVAALVHDGSSLPDVSCPLLRVPDTRLALGRLAAWWRRRFSLPLVGITGSNGKTTVKEMTAAILREHAAAADAVLATEGNLNNDIGLPLTLLKLRAAHRYAVIEMGMNHPGEIDYLTHIAAPDVALVNNAASAHLAGLGTVLAVARAKGEIFAGLGRQGVAVINADDPHAALWRELAAPHRVLDFGLETPAVLGCRWEVIEHGIQMVLHTPIGTCPVRLAVPGAHNARNALAAAAIALALEVPLAAIQRGLEQFGGVAGRLQRKVGRQGALLIDDTYNANPASMRAALQVLAQRPGQRIFVMGDMGELGEEATHFHAEIGALARQFGIQHLLALGSDSLAAVQAYGAGAAHFERIEDLCDALDALLAPDVTVLVKGSRFMRMERVVQHCSPRKEETCCSH